MKYSEALPRNGGHSPETSAKRGCGSREPLTSPSPDTISSPGTSEPAIDTPSPASRGKQASPSRYQREKEATSRRRAIITASLETIDLALQQMEPSERVAACSEINRRLQNVIAREVTRFLADQESSNQGKK